MKTIHVPTSFKVSQIIRSGGAGGMLRLTENLGPIDFCIENFSGCEFTVHVRDISKYSIDEELKVVVEGTFEEKLNLIESLE